jgi:glycosyltransferase involved in cell wall biosynthesis
VLEIGRRLVGRRVDVTVLAADPLRSQPRSEERDRMKIRRVAGWPRNRDYLVAPGVYKVVSQEDWDVVHVQSWQTAVPPLAMMAARRGARPYLVTPHGGYVRPIRQALQPLQRRAIAPLLRRAEYVVALTESQREALLEELGLERDRVPIIPNGSDLAEYLDAALRSAARNPGEQPIIVSAGRLLRYKGHHRVIAAIPHVLRSYPNARLRIIGSGPFEPELRRCAAKHGVAGRVTIESFSLDERPSLAAALAAADVGVLLSEYETQPLSVLELAALGVPVVVAATPGLRELAAAGLAHAVPLDAPSSQVAAAITLALEQPHNAVPPKLASWEAVTDALLELYRAVLDRRLARTERGHPT